MVAKKNDGTEYEPDTLKQFQCSVNRYFAEKKVLVNIIEDKEFKHSRDVLLSKRKQLRQMGKGNRPNRAEPFTKEEIQILYEKNYLGTGNYINILKFVHNPVPPCKNNHCKCFAVFLLLVYFNV